MGNCFAKENKEEQNGGLTREQKQLLRSNWQLVRANGLQKSGVEMFVKLFTDNPGVLPLFPFAKDKTVEELRMDDRLAKHASAVFNTVDFAIGKLDDLQQVVPKLVSLGERHHGYAISPDLFGPVAQALLATLAEVCGEKFTPEAKTAFVDLYTIVQTTMMQGYEAREKEKA